MAARALIVSVVVAHLSVSKQFLIHDTWKR